MKTCMISIKNTLYQKFTIVTAIVLLLVLSLCPLRPVSSLSEGVDQGVVVSVFDIDQFLTLTTLSKLSEGRIIPVLVRERGDMAVLKALVSDSKRLLVSIEREDGSLGALNYVLTKLTAKKIMLLLYSPRGGILSKEFLEVIYKLLNAPEIIVPVVVSNVDGVEEVKRLLQVHGISLKLVLITDENLRTIAKKLDAQVMDCTEYFSKKNAGAPTRRIVVTVEGDPFSILAPYYATLTDSSFLVVKSASELGQALKGIRPKSLVYVVSFDTLKGKGNIREVYKAAIKIDDDECFDASIGVVTATSISKLSIYMARYMLYQSILKHYPRKALLICMQDSVALSLKIERGLRYYGFTVEKLTDYRKGNLTRWHVLRELKEPSIITYINLHGNPLGMAPTTTGPFLISSFLMPESLPATIIVTLSCETVDIYEEYVRDPRQSIALQFVSKGAIAYIGAMKIEKSGDETSTGYPELIVQLCLQGYTLGEIVRIVNNIHICEIKGVDPWIRAYTVLLGDPDIRLSEFQADFEIRTLKPGEEYEIVFSRNCIAALIRLPIKGEHIAKVSINLPALFTKRYIEREDGRLVLNLCLTRILTGDVGDFGPNTSLKVTILYKPSPLIYYVTYASIIVAIVVLMLFLRRFEKKRKGKA